MRPSRPQGPPPSDLHAPLCSANCVTGAGPGSPAGSPRPWWPSPGSPTSRGVKVSPCLAECCSLAVLHLGPTPHFPSHPGPTPQVGEPQTLVGQAAWPGFPASLSACRTPPPYLWPLNLCERPALIYLQVLISFRLIEVQAHRASLFDPQIGYESQSNRLIFAHGFYPGLEAAGKINGEY